MRRPESSNYHTFCTVPPQSRPPKAPRGNKRSMVYQAVPLSVEIPAFHTPSPFRNPGPPAANPAPFPFVRQGHAVLYKKQIPKKPSLYSTKTQAAANNRAAAAIEKVPIHAYWLSSAVNILPPFLHLYPSNNRPNSGFRLTGNEPHSRFFLIQVPDFPSKPFMKYPLSCLPRWVYPLTECLFTEGDAHTFPQREHTAPAPLPFPQRKSAAERSVHTAYRRLGKPASGSKVKGLPVLFHRTPPRLGGVSQWYSGCQSAHPGNNTQ